MKSQPLHPQLVIRALIVIIFVLGLIAGYYYTKYGELQRSYNRLYFRYQDSLVE